MTPPIAPGAVVEPHTMHVVASYALTGLGLVGLAVWAWAASRHWAKRQRAAAALEADKSGEGVDG
jgi:hypothetical protein